MSVAWQGNERREHPRVPIAGELQGKIDVPLVDVSLSGALLEMPSTLSANAATSSRSWRRTPRLSRQRSFAATCKDSIAATPASRRSSIAWPYGLSSSRSRKKHRCKSSWIAGAGSLSGLIYPAKAFGVNVSCEALPRHINSLFHMLMIGICVMASSMLTMV